ncbi:MAG: hypothetical protein JWO46_375 [Nocardioidaceae bacterium]|nr:hypothetical protein [Nocardioidaceae bacterium]
MTAAPHDAPPALEEPVRFDRHAPTVEDLHGAVHRWTPYDAASLAWPALVEHLVAVGRTDVPVARLVEGHVDALRIHQQAGTTPVPGSLYAVWASRSHSTGVRGTLDGEEWVLDGTLRFASGSGVVERALVPVWTGPDDHVLLDLDVRAWSFDDTVWHTRAMAPARSHETCLTADRVSATQVGPVNFYLSRPGFFPGGVAVAAAWTGGALRVLDLLLGTVPAGRRSDGQSIRIGRIRTELAAMTAVLRQTALQLDDGVEDPRLTSTTARAAVANGVRRVLVDVRSVAGPAGLAMDEDLTRAIDDLFLFVAQQNEDADALWLGSRQ